MPAYTPTTPPYKDQNIYICDVVDLPPEDDDVKSRAMRRDTYFYLNQEMDITVTAIRLPDNSGPVVDPLVADAVVTPTAGVTTPPLTINFDGSGSTGAIISYLWELDKDGGGYGPVSSEIASNFQLTAPGTYTLRLTVTQLGGATATDSVVITAT